MLAEQDDEVPAQEVGLILDRGAPACRHEHVEQLAVARLTRGISRCGMTRSPRPRVPLQFDA